MPGPRAPIERFQQRFPRGSECARSGRETYGRSTALVRGSVSSVRFTPLFADRSMPGSCPPTAIMLRLDGLIWILEACGWLRASAPPCTASVKSPFSVSSVSRAGIEVQLAPPFVVEIICRVAPPMSFATTGFGSDGFTATIPNTPVPSRWICVRAPVAVAPA